MKQAKKGYRYRLGVARRKDIETHRYFLLFTEWLNLIERG